MSKYNEEASALLASWRRGKALTLCPFNGQVLQVKLIPLKRHFDNSNPVILGLGRKTASRQKGGQDSLLKVMNKTDGLQMM